MLTKTLCLLLLSLAGNTYAGANEVMIDQVWVGESIPGQNSATLELNITAVKQARLINLSSEVTDKIEIHRVARHGGKMQAQVIPNLRLPAHRTTAFGSHQFFLIMVGLKKELNIGDKIPVSLVVEYSNSHRQTISVEATVKKMALSYKHLGSEEVHDHR